MTTQAAKELRAFDEQAIAELERGLPGGNLGAALETFATEVEKRDVEIRNLLTGGDYDALAAVAHGLKGSAATFCAPALAHAAMSLEEKLPDRDARNIELASRTLCTEAARAVRQIRKFLAHREGAGR